MNRRKTFDPAPKAKIRQADIAREAGASLATVDRVLNGRPGVAKHTKQRILEALRRLQRAAVAPARSAASLKFDFIFPGGPNTFWTLVSNGITAAQTFYSDQGVVIRSHPIVGFNAHVLADSIRRFGKGSDGVAFVALENPLIREAVTEIYEAGTPVVTMVADLSTERKIGYVGLNNRAAGRTAGYLMGRFLAGRKGKIALFEGSIDLSYRDHQERDTGFNDVLRELFPNLEVAVRRPTHDCHETAYRETAKALREHPDLLGLYNVGGGLRGNVQALLESKRHREIVCIGHELTSFNRQFLVDGTLDAVIDQDPALQTREAARLLLDFHRNQGRHDKAVTPEVKVYLRENLP